MKTTRRIVQFGFLALTLVGVYALKGNAERWCPFGGVEALYMYARKGHMLCSLGVSNFYILAAVLLLALLLRRVFCGYMCPIGTISEWLGAAAKRWDSSAKGAGGGRPGLSLLKYGVLVLILWVTGGPANCSSARPTRVMPSSAVTVRTSRSGRMSSAAESCWARCWPRSPFAAGSAPRRGVQPVFPVRLRTGQA